MIIHLIRSQEFLGYTVEYFEEVNRNNNRYYFISDGTKLNISSEIENRIDIIEAGSSKYQELLNNCSQYDTFIFHSLHNVFFPIIERIPQDRTLCWIMYGMEVYGIFKELRNDTFLPETTKFYRFSKEGISNYFKPFYRKLIGKPDNENKYLNYIKRFNFCAAPHPTLYELLKKMGIQNLEYLKFSYYNIEKTVGNQLLNSVAEGEDIFLGNSASFSNNHLDGFKLLQNISFNNRRLVVPLSYGDREVIKRVKAVGEKTFGVSFVPVLTHLPRDEYNQLMLSCKFVIMNHLRPQARGNLLTALWLGAKVFLQEENNFYNEFAGKGIVVFSMNEFKNNTANVLKPLSSEEIESNRTILLKYYNKENALAFAKQMVKKLHNPK